MKKTIYRYIAIAFAVLALFVAYVEINVSGIPFFAFICALAAKQFYDDSNGRVYGQSQSRPDLTSKDSQKAADSYQGIHFGNPDRLFANDDFYT